MYPKIKLPPPLCAINSACTWLPGISFTMPSTIERMIAALSITFATFGRCSQI